MIAHRAFLFFSLLSLFISGEFRLAFQNDGRTWFAVFISVSFNADEAPTGKVPPPILASYSPVSLSIRETMYLRNRLEEILDDTDEEVLEKEEDTIEEGVDGTSTEDFPFF